LKVLTLENQPDSGAITEPGGSHDGRTVDERSNALASGADIGESEHGIVVGDHGKI
jgi:hypothetical protein